MFYIRTKTGLELVVRAVNLNPDRDGFCRMSGVYRLKYAPGSMQSHLVSLVFRKGMTTAASISRDSIEILSEALDFEEPKG